MLPRVPYDNRIDPTWRYAPGTRQRRGPESQRVVPAPPAAGGDPARFMDPRSGQPIRCEWLRRLANRTGRLYWVTRYEHCLGLR